MPAHKFTAVHYALIEVLETTAKALSKIRVRLNRGSIPTQNEPTINAHQIRRALSNLAEITQTLADEHQTLTPEVAGAVTERQLRQAAEAISVAVALLPETP